MNIQTQLIIVNQGVGMLPREFVTIAAAALGHVTFLCPDNALEGRENIRSVDMPVHRTSSTVARLWGWFAFTVRALWWLLLDRSRAPLLLISNPPLIPLMGIVAHYLQRRPFFLLVYDVYPEAIEQVGALDRKGLIARLWRKMNQLAIRTATTVFTISEGMAATLKQYTQGECDRQIEIIPTWVDTSWIRPIPKANNPFAHQYDQQDKLTILYAGNIGRVHDLTMLPRLAQRVQEIAKIHFLVIGDGAGRKALLSACSEERLANVTFLPMQEEAMLPYSLATADISIVALAPAGEGVSMPSKTYYAMAAGSAILGISRTGSDLAQVITRYRCGINVEPDAVEQAAAFLIELSEHPDRLDTYRRAARAAAETQFTRDIVVARLLTAIRSATATDY